jgi:hypothetical protein
MGEGKGRDFFLNGEKSDIIYTLRLNWLGGGCVFSPFPHLNLYLILQLWKTWLDKRLKDMNYLSG